jgi:hypothetical protein
MKPNLKPSLPRSLHTATLPLTAAALLSSVSLSEASMPPADHTQNKMPNVTRQNQLLINMGQLPSSFKGSLGRREAEIAKEKLSVSLRMVSLMKEFGSVFNSEDLVHKFTVIPVKNLRENVPELFRFAFDSKTKASMFKEPSDYQRSISIYQEDLKNPGINGVTQMLVTAPDSDTHRVLIFVEFAPTRSAAEYTAMLTYSLASQLNFETRNKPGDFWDYTRNDIKTGIEFVKNSKDRLAALSDSTRRKDTTQFLDRVAVHLKSMDSQFTAAALSDKK